MALYLRRLVSGKKTRFRDDQLNLELDLAYVTDQIIVMGFPALGVESMYRNPRADVQRFLSARHGANFWVYNFCPLTENAYPESVFEGHVSRYPFPDHHVPPFLYLPLVVREIHAWLSGSDARVAVLHCKAGKGRSGTLACAYLLSLRAPPSTSVTSLSTWSLIGDKEGLQAPSEDISTATPAAIDLLSPHPSVSSGPVLSRVSSEPIANTLAKILDLHTSKRMKPSLHSSRYHSGDPPAKKPNMGISIPSQQRWLFYWSQVLDGKGPRSLQPFPAKDRLETPLDKTTKVKLTKLQVRMRESSMIQPHLMRAASLVIASSGKGRAVNESVTGRLWASLARYSDQLVDELNHWEKESRYTTDMIDSNPFRSDRWDRARMVHSFAQMGMSNVQPTQEGESKRPVLTYVLRPMDVTEGNWVELPTSLPESTRETLQQGTSVSESSSYAFVSTQVEDDLEDPLDIVLDGDRELRIKLFMGEVVRLVYILRRGPAHLVLTGCSRMGMDHTYIPHIAQYSVIQPCSIPR